MDMITTSGSYKWEQMQVADLQAPAATTHRVLPSAATQQQHLRCPRCDSTNTKFCYYNNYSLSQPRHFCKACKRYWTRGGTLRNVPVGGGCRKNKRIKRSTSSSSSSSAAAAAVVAASNVGSSCSNKTTSLLPIAGTTCSRAQTMAMPTSSNLNNPFLYTHSLRIPHMDNIGIVNEFESVLGNPIVTGTFTSPKTNEFQSRQHSTISGTLLQNYPFFGTSSPYPSSPREIKTTNVSSSSSSSSSSTSSSLFPLYLHGLQTGSVFAGDVNLGLLKQEAGMLDLQHTSGENHLEPWASGAVNPLWNSPISAAWSTEPAATTMFGPSSTTPLI